ncbi:hypothetical protein LXL04_004642 [Taraxacum kok-saghyz]
MLKLKKSCRIATASEPYGDFNFILHRFDRRITEYRSRFEARRFDFEIADWSILACDLSDFGVRVVGFWRASQSRFSTANLRFHLSMVFGRKKNQDAETLPTQSDSETEGTHISETQEPTAIDIDAEVQQQSTPTSHFEIDPSKPLHAEVTYLPHPANCKTSGGTKHWTCNHCKLKFVSSYTRIHIHFFGAPVGKKTEIRRCSVLSKNNPYYETLYNRVKEAEKNGVAAKSLKNSVLLKNTGFKRKIEDAFKMLERDEVDMKIIRGLCANGIPFNVLRNPQFLEMIQAIQKAPDGYKPPSYENARTSLLDQCAREVGKELDPVKDTWLTQGVSIVSDGWSNVKSEPLINVIAQNSRGATFMYADAFSGIEKTGVVIAKFLREAIEDIGPSSVLQVVTDNAANCKAAGREIEKVYKHIFWSPCCVHSLNLIFKDMAKKFEWLSKTYKRGKGIVKFFLNHTHALAFFRDNSKLQLLKVAQTRFASHYILLKRLTECREALATTIVLNSWREWVNKVDEHTRIIANKVGDTIKDEDFWDDIAHILAVTKPIFYMVKFCDGEGPKMAEIYERLDNMKGQIKEAMTLRDNKFSMYYPEVEQIVVQRWDKMTIPLHCLGYALNPKYYDKRYLEKLGPGGMKRNPPNQDKEVIVGVLKAFARISESEEEEKLLREQFASFHMKKGIYALAGTQADAVTMDAIDWWATYGAETPDLADVAKRVLSQPISSSSAERNWSTYSHIHSVKWNRLNGPRADKLVFIHSNIRLLSRFSESYKAGPNKKWDINPESDHIESSSARLEEMVWENLDA